MKEIVKRLEDSSVFKEWKKDHENDYLSSMFLASSKDKPNENWQLDYYNKVTDKMTSFVLEGDNVVVAPENDIFKKKNDVVKPLNLDDIKIKLDDALKKVLDIMKAKDTGEEVNKQIIILQNLDKLVWNITLLTSCFNLMTVRINAVNGEVVHESYGSLMNTKST